MLRDMDRPKKIDIDRDFSWVVRSLGLSGTGDTDTIKYKILRNAIEDIAKDGSSTSERISGNLGLSVQRVNYHLRPMIDSGFLYRDKRRIYVRKGSIASAVEEIRKDANRMLDDVERIARQLDEGMGLRNR